MGEQADRGKAMYKRYVDEVINCGDVSVVDELYDPRYVDHDAPPGAPPGLGAVRMVPRVFRRAFSDLRFTVDQLIGEGDLVATRVTGRGTHDGPLPGVPATGRTAVWASFGVFRVAADGRIVEHWGQPDLVDLLQQLGALPGEPPGEPAPLPEPRARSGTAGDEDVPRNRATVTRLYRRVLGDGHTEYAAELTADDYVDHPTARTVVRGSGMRVLSSHVRDLRSAFPDLAVAFDLAVAERDLVALRMVLKGTHCGTYAGLPATGRPVEFSGIAVHRLQGGRVVERWGALDRLALMQQLGRSPLSSTRPVEPATAS